MINTWRKKKRKIIIGTFILICIAVGVISYKIYGEEILKVKSEKTTDMDVGDTILTDEQKKIWNSFKNIYNVQKQTKIKEAIEKEKEENTYTEQNMLIKYNPYGTNTQSLYVYFSTDDAVSVSYKIHVEDKEIEDFSQEVYQEEEYQKEHEFQIIGLIPNAKNQITITMKTEDGEEKSKVISYTMGDLFGEEDVILEQTQGESLEKVSNGLYVVLGNDSDNLDFMYYYDNNGVLRGEVPIIGYRSHRLLFSENEMYYSISQTQIARVDRLGQVTMVYDTGVYNLHHDYVFDGDGNLLTLATDTRQESVEDIILKIDEETGKITEVLDMEEVFSDYKKTCESAEDGDLDWMHLNTIQWVGEGEILLSSRETSTIIKISNLYQNPEIEYMIGEKDFWEGTGYESLLYDKEGDFTIQGGQHSITYVKEDGMEEGKYYLYMYNNNIGYSESKPEYDWSAIGLTNAGGKGGTESYYYKYLVDETKQTFCLVDSFAVDYSGYVSSAQEIDENVIMNSGIPGVFAEYDKEHQLINSYKMEVEKYIYRVYKYNFKGFYFS